MADISIQEDRAKVWIGDVQEEIEQVEGVLKNVTVSITTIPTSDDTIFQGIRKAGEVLRTGWDRVCGVFKEVGGIVNDVINKTTSTAAELSAEVDRLAQKYGE